MIRNFLAQPLLHKIAIVEEVRDHSFDLKRSVHQHHKEWGELLLIGLSYVVFSLALSLVSTSAVVYTVACLCTRRELSYATVISVVPRVWRRLMITFLCFVGIMFVYYVAVDLVIFLWILINFTQKINWGVFWFGIGVIAIVVFCVHVYISMVWQLASVVSVVEDKYGLGAMQKSRDLIKGKRGAALALYIISTVIVEIIWYLFKPIVTVVGEGFSSGAVLVVVHCAVNVMWLLTQSVLYFVCKSYHHQSIDKSALSDHLEGYLGEYMPLKRAIQLETLDP